MLLVMSECLLALLQLFLLVVCVANINQEPVAPDAAAIKHDQPIVNDFPAKSKQ